MAIKIRIKPGDKILEVDLKGRREISVEDLLRMIGLNPETALAAWDDGKIVLFDDDIVADGEELVVYLSLSSG